VATVRRLDEARGEATPRDDGVAVERLGSQIERLGSQIERALRDITHGLTEGER
jgi:hypothetical protein